MENEEMIAVLVKNNELSEYPADFLIDGKIVKSYNLEFELEAKNINLLIGKSLPSPLIKSLRDKGITFLKVNSLEELSGLDLDIKLPKDLRFNRGAGCQSRFKLK